MAAYLTEVRVVFVLRRSAMICTPSTFNSLPPKLRTRTESGCQRLLTVGTWANCAYFSVWRASFDLSASPSAFAPSGPTPLNSRLQTESTSECQWLLTEG